jgi:hypothetical protein
MITKYRFENIENYDEFINNLFNGLKYYESKNLGFKFKLKYTKEYIELITFKLKNESLN